MSRCVGCRRRACLTHWTAAHPRSRALKPSRRFPSRVFFLRSQFSLPLCQAAAKSEVEECIHRLQSTNKGVQTIIIVNNDGVSALNHCLPTLLWRVEQLRASSLTYPRLCAGANPMAAAKPRISLRGPPREPDQRASPASQQSHSGLGHHGALDFILLPFCGSAIATRPLRRRCLTSDAGCLQNDWTFLRVRSHKHEIMVCPEKEFMMIVVQVARLTPTLSASLVALCRLLIFSRWMMAGSEYQGCGSGGR